MLIIIIMVGNFILKKLWELPTLYIYSLIKIHFAKESNCFTK